MLICAIEIRCVVGWLAGKTMSLDKNVKIEVPEDRSSVAA